MHRVVQEACVLLAPALLRGVSVLISGVASRLPCVCGVLS